MMWVTLTVVLCSVLTPRTYAFNPESNNPSTTPDGKKLWDGDMILSEEQLDFFYGDQKVELRKAISIKNMLWPNGIVKYRLTPSILSVRGAIQEALNYVMNNTCVTFQEIPEQIPEPHIIFVKESGCWSDVGRKFWQDGQQLSLGYGCEKLGRIVHEVGHALGFHHEHSRPDRDKHVKLFTENYDSAKQDNFKKQTYVNNYNVPYDYESIMHYSLYAFSTNDKKTIGPLDPTKQFLMGQREHLSFYDKKLLNTMYTCSAHCGQDVVCANEGYLSSSCQCQCKPGFTGPLCEDQSPIAGGCGGYVYTEKTIQSPDYPKFYPPDQQCVWWIKAPEGKKVQVHFDDFDIRHREDDTLDCYFDKVEVRTDDIFFGQLYCGEELKGKTLKSKENSLVLILETKSRLNRGFSTRVTFV